MVENDSEFVKQEFLIEDTMLDIFFILINIFTLGVYYLLVKWYPHLKLKFYAKTENIHDAKFVIFRKLVEDEFVIHLISRNEVHFHPWKNPEHQTYITHNNQKYIY